MSRLNLPKEWDKMAEVYQKIYNLGLDDVHYGPRCPREKELGLLGNVNGKRIIEIGSGAAQNSICLAKQGAKVTALDFSYKQLEIGKKLARKEGVKVDFVRANFEKLNEFFNENAYDIALSAYALQYSSSLDAMKKTFKGINHILQKNGFLVFSLDHPLRLCGSWDLDKDVFLINNYFDRSKINWEYFFAKDKIATKSTGFLGTFSDIITGVLDAGFSLEKILEPLPSKDNSSPNILKLNYEINEVNDPDSFEKLSRIPGTLIIKAKKR